MQYYIKMKISCYLANIEGNGYVKIDVINNCKVKVKCTPCAGSEALYRPYGPQGE
jgi:hypothetical protein